MTAGHRVRRTRRRPVLAMLLPIALVALLGACTTAPAAPPRHARQVEPALHAQLPPSIRRSGTLTAATDASYPPSTFFAADCRTVVGFEADLAAELAAVLGVRVEFVVTDFTAAVPALQQGRVDMVLSAMTDTAEREKHADFVNYFSAGTAILVQRGNPHGITGLGDLCGRHVSVERGTVQVQLLARSQRHCDSEPMRVHAHRTNADALVELRTGRAAAVLNDYPPAVFLSTQPGTRADYQLASDVQYEPGLYGIAVSKDDARLRYALQQAMRLLVASGRYDAVLQKWDVSEGAVGTVTVNAG